MDFPFFFFFFNVPPKKCTGKARGVTNLVPWWVRDLPNATLHWYSPLCRWIELLWPINYELLTMNRAATSIETLQLPIYWMEPARLLVALASLEPVKILSSSPPHRKAPSKWALTIAHFHLTCLGLPLIIIINQLTVMRCCYFIKQQDWRCCVISPNGLPPNSHLWRWRRWWWSMEGTGSDNNSRCGPSHLLAWLKAWP